jgi:hypothetical protein
MEQVTITGPDDLYQPGFDSVAYTKDPVFEFKTEVDALMTFQALRYNLEAAREEERQVLRYMEAAAKAARQGTFEDGPVTPQAIINESGVARQTVYNWIGSAGGGGTAR